MPFQPGYYGKRSSFSLTSIASLVAWWEPDYGITKDGSNLVSAWKDKKADLTLAQATGSKQPLWVTNLLNGHAGVRGDGTDDSMTVALAQAQPIHMFLLCNFVAANDQERLISGRFGSGADAPGGVTVRDSATHLVLTEGGNEAQNISFTVGTPLLINAFYSGASSKVAKNNGSYTSAVSVTTAALVDVKIFGGQNNETATFTANAEIFSLAYFNAELTGTDLTNVLAYYGTMSGLW